MQLPEFCFALLMEALYESVCLTLQRPPQADTASTAQIFSVFDERLHGLTQTHKL